MKGDVCRMKLTRKWKWAIGLLAFILLAGLIGYANRTAIALWGFDAFFSDDMEKRLEITYKPIEGRKRPVEAVKYERRQPFTMLLLGIDARGKERGRSDTMLLTVVRPADGALLMVSIPRDTYVDIPGRKRGDKITHAYAYGEAKLAIETVERYFGLPVQSYASINFTGFREVVDALGGIRLPIENDLVNDDPMHEKFVVKAGQPFYNGTDALNYVRFRGDAGGDANRAERNQLFIKAILDRAAEIGQWTKIPELIDIMGHNFQTDVSPEDMIDLAKRFVLVDTRTIHSYTLKGKGVLRGGVWYYEVDEEEVGKAKAWMEAWLKDSTPQSSLPIPGQETKDKQPAALSAPKHE